MFTSRIGNFLCIVALYDGIVDFAAQARSLKRTCGAWALGCENESNSAQLHSLRQLPTAADMS